jgi:uncharacterized protein (DUF1697 family)
MTSYVALLRAVNLGGDTVLKMEDLRNVLAALGLKDVRTLLQSGNAVFRAPTVPPASVELRLERELERRLRLSTDLFVRTSEEWTEVVKGNPFPKEAKSDPAHLTVAFLKAAPQPAAWSALRHAIRGPERVEGAGREAYIVYPEGIGRSRLTPAIIERSLGTRATSRNWNTIQKLDSLASAP